MKIFENAGHSFTCGRMKAEVFDDDNVYTSFPTSITHALCLFSVFVWTGKNNSNTLRVDAYFFFENGGKNSLFQTKPDTTNANDFEILKTIPKRVSTY